MSRPMTSDERDVAEALVESLVLGDDIETIDTAGHIRARRAIHLPTGHLLVEVGGETYEVEIAVRAK